MGCNYMNKTEIQKRINGLNEYMLSNSDKKILLLTTSSIYTYNKAIAIVDKNDLGRNDWYSIDNKSCFKSWNEIETFLDGLKKKKNTNFEEKER